MLIAAAAAAGLRALPGCAGAQSDAAAVQIDRELWVGAEHRAECAGVLAAEPAVAPLDISRRTADATPEVVSLRLCISRAMAEVGTGVARLWAPLAAWPDWLSQRGRLRMTAPYVCRQPVIRGLFSLYRCLRNANHCEDGGCRRCGFKSSLESCVANSCLVSEVAKIVAIYRAFLPLAGR